MAHDLQEKEEGVTGVCIRRWWLPGLLTARGAQRAKIVLTVVSSNVNTRHQLFWGGLHCERQLKLDSRPLEHFGTLFFTIPT
jgi:hypothetical protein